MNARRLLCAALLSLALPAAVAAPSRAEHVEVELVAETTALQPGGASNWVALRLQPDAGWHVYWLNPGDSGIPTSLTWKLPDGVSAGPMQWVYPRLHRLGELVNYGYGEETLHLIPVQLDERWQPGQRVELRAQAKWLVCRDICIPGSAELLLNLPVDTAAPDDPAWGVAFDRARAELPSPMPGWSARFAVAGGSFSLALDGANLAGRQLEFFPEPNDLVNHAAPQRLAIDGSGLRLSQALSAYFVDAPTELRGVLVARGREGVRAWQIVAPPGQVAVVPASTAVGASVVATPPPRAEPVPPGLALALLSALLGGLILNLMPCVFPVLSLKALSLLEARGQHARAARQGALAYTAGVILSFVVVVGLLLALRAAGRAVGWGFQLQSPVFVGLMAYLLFGLGLSMSGMVQFGTRWMGAGQGLTEDRGWRGAFFTGVLAVVVASPCTVPFMGTALGYAVTQSAPLAVLVFATLGLGLALPFLLIGFFPRLGAWLPRPGAWMETFKQAMAFPLYLSVAWLLWVLARQAGPDAAGLALLGLVLIAFALWLWPRPSLAATALRLFALLAAGLLLLREPLQPAPPTEAAVSAAGESAWSPAKVEALRAEGRTIFVDFTADWCLTCKLNERVALKSDKVQQGFRDRGVVFLKGDWTRNDPAITAVLEHFQRPGVPLYLVYVKGGEPKVLPQLLTPEIVLEAIEP